MAFQEKSAWVMVIALLITGTLFYSTLFTLSNSGELVAPHMPIFIGFTVLLTLLAIIGHIVIAVISPKEANAQVDEREKRVFDKAGNLSGMLFGAGTITALLFYLASNNGHVLFYSIFSSLLVAQILEYGLQIYFFRRPLL